MNRNPECSMANSIRWPELSELDVGAQRQRHLAAVGTSSLDTFINFSNVFEDSNSNEVIESFMIDVSKWIQSSCVFGGCNRLNPLSKKEGIRLSETCNDWTNSLTFDENLIKIPEKIITQRGYWLITAFFPANKSVRVERISIGVKNYIFFK